ncbi:unnamed protein product [Merluccius merluccius]
MECAFDAQNLISISLRKIQSSRTQRGGIKLHKNLLVTYVLRNARQLYVNKNFTQIQRTHHHHHHLYHHHHLHHLHHHHPYEDVTAACQEQDYLELSSSFTEWSDDFCCNFGGVESGRTGGHPADSAHQDAQDAPACAAVAQAGDPSSSFSSSSNACWTCCAERSSWDLPPTTQSNQKTVLDLDTHVVTTVTSGYFHSDCCAPPPPSPRPPLGAQGSGCSSRKRRMDASYHFVDPEFDLQDLGPLLPCSKRGRTDEDFQSDSDQLDTANISNIISVLGSGGLSEFMTWQHTDLEQIFASQSICLKQKLLSGSGWTRAIEAF